MQRFKLWGSENALVPDEDGELVDFKAAMQDQETAIQWERRRIFLEATRRGSRWPDGKQGVNLADLGEILGLR